MLAGRFLTAAPPGKSELFIFLISSLCWLKNTVNLFFQEGDLFYDPLDGREAASQVVPFLLMQES